MREIKFRAWDKKEQLWVGGFCIHQSGLFSDLINAHIEMPQLMPIADAHWQRVPDNIVIQQFTGLHDKNGREIYEGDIYKIVTSQGVSLGGGKPWSEKHHVVEYTITPENGNAAYYLPKCSMVEIIGNIYSNPELLT